MKRIYIDDIIHQQLKREAKAEGRTLQWLVEYKLTGEITPSPKNTEPIKVEDMHSNMGSPSAKIAVEPSAVVDDLFNAHTPRSEANPSEFPCCANEIQPCKHWVWDINLAVWKNSLSGRLMEAE